MSEGRKDRFPGMAHPAQPAQPADAVVLGEALVDLFPDSLADPLAGPPGSPLEDTERFVRHLGGAGANLAVDLCRQGVKAALCTMVGGDAFGRFLRNRLRDEGVAIDGMATHKTARTGVTFVSFASSGAPGERSFLFYGRPSADMHLGPETPVPLLRRGRLLCLGSSTLVLEPGRAATARALTLCRGAGMLVACDLNFRAHKWLDAQEAPPLLRRLLGQCDVVKLTQSELLPVLGTEQVEAAADRVRKLGVTLVVVTLGERGCYLDCPAGQVYLAADRAKVVDPTGAGDAFFAGLLSVLLEELGPPGAPGLADVAGAAAMDDRRRLRELTLSQCKRACARGNYLGSRACTALGATTAVPRLGATDEKR